LFVEAPEGLDEKVGMLKKVLEKLQEKGRALGVKEGGKKEEEKEEEDPSLPLPLPKTMIFLNTAQAAARVQDALAQAGFPSVAFHKEVRSSDREENLRQFRENQVPLLVCTDLASRGLDIPDVKQIIQVEFAPNVVQHLHRIGRAVRAGREGRAVNFFDEGSADLVESLQLAGEESLDRSFSRQRGFRKKVKKYGQDYYRKPGGRTGGRGGRRRRRDG
jgi:superfamily II DNA/RNA helicase